MASNPVKSSFLSSYVTSFCINRVYTKTGSFSARGKAKVYFPSELVEALYPGKLYTAAGNKTGKNFLVENGAQMLLEVKYLNKGDKDSFLVKRGKLTGWHGLSFWGFLNRLRAYSRLRFKRLMYGWKEGGGFLLSLLSGSREYTEKILSDSFRDSGLSYIIALSGFHLGLFTAFSRLLTGKRLPASLSRLFEIFSVLLFVWFAGLSPSLFRALLACLILYAVSALRLSKPDSLSLLSLCFIIHCIIFPSHIHELSFMFSYASLSGIIIAASFIKKIIPPVFPGYLRYSLSDSISAFIASMPLSIHFFGKVMPQGLFASLFISPLVFIFIYTGLFGIIICLFLPFLSVPISDIINIIYLLIKRIVLFFTIRK